MKIKVVPGLRRLAELGWLLCKMALVCSFRYDLYVEFIVQ